MKLLREIHEQLQFNKQLKRFTENSEDSAINDMQKHYSDDPDVQAAYEDGFDTGLNDEDRWRNSYDKK